LCGPLVPHSIGGMRGLSVLFSLAALGLSGAPSTAADTPDRVYRADGKWIANWGEDRCRISRSFVERDGDTLVLFFEQLGPASTLRLLAAGKDINGLADAPGFVTIAFEGFPKADHGFLQGNFGDYGTSIFLAGVLPFGGGPVTAEDEPQRRGTQLDSARAREVSSFTLADLNYRVQINTGSLEHVFEALNSCSRDLMETEGMRMEELAKVATPPTLTNGEEVWRLLKFRSGEFGQPTGREGIFDLRIVLDAEGKIEFCRLVAGSAEKGFRDDHCDVFRDRAQFTPGTDAEGRPVRSLYTRRLVKRDAAYWRIPAKRRVPL